MTFNADFFQPIGGQSRADTTVLADATTPRAPQIFTYLTTDAHATVDDAGYFNSVRDKLQIGDVIFVSVINSSNALQTYGTHCVVDKSATSVDTTNVTVGLMTDTN